MAEIIKIDPNSIDLSLIKEAALVVRRGGLVAFPTETVYGLGVNAFDEEAARKVYEVKERSPDKPLAVCVSSLDQIRLISSSVPKEAEAVIGNFLPGPLTVILEKSKRVPSAVTASGANVGIRYPDHKIALALIDAAGVPLAATSANVSGRPSPCSVGEIETALSGRIDLIIDGGACKFKMASTVIDLSARPFKMLREGAISRKELDAFLAARGFSPLDGAAGNS